MCACCGGLGGGGRMMVVVVAWILGWKCGLEGRIASENFFSLGMMFERWDGAWANFYIFEIC